MQSEPTGPLDAQPPSPSVEMAPPHDSTGGQTPENHQGFSIWMLLLISGGMALIVTSLALGGYDWLTKRNSRFGLVDLQSVFDAKQIEFTEMALRPGATDKDREDALALAQDVSNGIVKAIDDVAAECGCVLLVRAAVVGSAVPDYTKSLMAKMGMSPEKVEATKKRLSEQMKRQASNTSNDLAETVLGVRKPLVPKNK